LRKEIRITGIGGQGAITAGNILARAAVLYDNKEAVLTEGYSPYVVGGWSRADVIIQEEKIDFPVVSRLDVLVSMYQEGLDLNYRLIKSGGVALAEARLVSVGANLKNTEDRRVLLVPAAAEAERLGKKMVTNIVLLGSLEAVAPVVNIESLRRALVDRFPKAAELNMQAIASGYELGLKALKEQEGQVQIA